MYPPKLFHSEDRDEALAIARAVRFATVAYVVDGAVEVVFAPFIVDDSGLETALVGHLLRSNPIRALTESGPLDCRLVFNAADGYLSPRIYAEKAATGRVVPTWNYVACQFEGALSQVADARLQPILETQIADYESMVGSDWVLADAPDDYVAQLKKAIFGVRFVARSCTVNKKLSQNKGAERPRIRDWFAGERAPHRVLRHWYDALDA